VACHIRPVRSPHRPDDRVEAPRRRVAEPQRLAELGQLVGDVLSQLPIDVADAAAELAGTPHGWRIIAPGGVAVHGDGR